MKKYMLLFLLLAFLPGCATAPQETPTPTEAPTPTIEPTPTPTPEPLTAEQAAEIYIHFLKNEIPCHEGDHSLYYSDFSRTEEIPITGFYIRDLTGDGLPELYAPDWKWPSIPVWSIQNGELTAIHSGSSYDTLLANGGIFTYVSGTAQSDVYAYCWLSPESREYPEIFFEAYDMDSDGEMDSFYIDYDEVTKAEWEARTAPYFALRDAEPTEEQKALPFLQWAAELGADIADFLDLEPWQVAYLELLAGYETRRAEYSADAQEFYMERYALYDIDKDGIPELFLIHGLADDGSATRGTGDAWFSCDLYTAQNGKFVYLKPNPEDNRSFWFGSLYSCPGENAVLYGEGKNFRKVSILDGKREDGPNLPLPEDTPYEQITAQLFVPEAEELARYEPTDLQPILDYAPPLEPWQAAYWDILTNPGKYEEFYAVAEHIPSENLWRLEATIEDGDPYYFAIADLNHDEIPELLLGIGFTYSSPRVLLNILRYNKEAGAVEDIDGPRAYPLMDNLWFYDTGYFSTTNGVGGLYTEFWHLEDPDPEHYWYGYQRPYDADYDGERTTEIISFYSTDGEEFTLQEYYDRMGESGIGVEWLELTPKNIRQAFFPAEGEEVTP